MIKRTEREIMKNWKDEFNNPIVSICCITYNHEAYIAEAIDSFLIQETDFPFEILIRDDCSTDKTTEIIKEYVSKYPNLIKAVYEKENTFSKGIRPMPQLYKIAQGKYIAPCEGDDYWTDPLKLQKQTNYLINNPLYYGCFHDCTILNERKENHKKQHLRIGKRKIDEDVDLISLINENNIATASIMFKNFITEIPKYWRDTSKGDYALMITIAVQGKIRYLPEVMSVYRVHDTSIWSSRSEIYKEKEAIEFYSLLQEHFKDNNYILKALSRKKKYVYYLLSRKYLYDKQRLKSIYCLILSLDFLHDSHSKIKYYPYFKEFLKSILK